MPKKAQILKFDLSKISKDFGLWRKHSDFAEFKTAGNLFAQLSAQASEHYKTLKTVICPVGAALWLGKCQRVSMWLL